jgi:Zn finger protein HypA/HybF involved in hydrogenase expression
MIDRKEFNRLQQLGTSRIPMATPLSSRPVVGYCVKCKAKRNMLNARAVTLKNGRSAMQGICPVCGTKMFRISK